MLPKEVERNDGGDYIRSELERMDLVIQNFVAAGHAGIIARRMHPGASLRIGGYEPAAPVTGLFRCYDVSGLAVIISDREPQQQETAGNQGCGEHKLSDHNERLR